MYLFFDTETTGTHKGARMTQLAFILTDSEGNILKEFESLIKPDGWTVPTSQFFIDNNMSTERCEEHGIPVLDALKDFAESLSKCKYKIAHNLKFDKRIMTHEIQQTGFTGKKFLATKEFCTMLSTVDYCQIPGKFGKFKWPKLSELHIKLFGFDFDDAHDALADVKAMIKCFFELKKRGIINLD